MAEDDDLLNPYQLLRREDGSRWTMDEGPLGTVYKARHVTLKEDVALRIIDPALVGPATFQALVGAARHVREARSPIIATVRDVLVVKDKLLVVEEFVPGESVEQIIRQTGSMSPEEAVIVAACVAEALKAARWVGWVHGAITPANLLVVKVGAALRVKMTGFALRRVVAAARPPGSDFVGFDPVYASPEQVAGKAPDQRSDFFSLGSVLRFASDHSPIAPPANWRALLRRMMDSDLEKRPQTTDELIRLIENCIGVGADTSATIMKVDPKTGRAILEPQPEQVPLAEVSELDTTIGGGLPKAPRPGPDVPAGKTPQDYANDLATTYVGSSSKAAETDFGGSAPKRPANEVSGLDATYVGVPSKPAKFDPDTTETKGPPIDYSDLAATYVGASPTRTSINAEIRAPEEPPADNIDLAATYVGVSPTKPSIDAEIRALEEPPVDDSDLAATYVGVSPTKASINTEIHSPEESPADDSDLAATFIGIAPKKTVIETEIHAPQEPAFDESDMAATMLGFSPKKESIDAEIHAPAEQAADESDVTPTLVGVSPKQESFTTEIHVPPSLPIDDTDLGATVVDVTSPDFEPTSEKVEDKDLDAAVVDHHGIDEAPTVEKAENTNLDSAVVDHPSFDEAPLVEKVENTDTSAAAVEVPSLHEAPPAVTVDNTDLGETVYEVSPEAGSAFSEPPSLLPAAEEENPKSISLIAQTPAEAAPPTPPAAVDENIQFTAYRPKIIRPARWTKLLVFAHLDQRPDWMDADERGPLEEVAAQARQFLGEKVADYRATTEDSLLAIPRDGEITLAPVMEGVEFSPPRRSFFWRDGISVHSEMFEMRASAALDGKNARGRLTIFMGSLILAEINLVIRVDSAQAVPGAAPAQAEDTGSGREHSTARPFRRIFASYSHRDIGIVETVEKHARTLGDEYLRDTQQLRSGESWGDRLLEMIDDADVFQLFWSANAARSEFVAQEWNHALALGRTTFVRPTYWEQPMPEPPPPLRGLHFYRLGSAPDPAPVESKASEAVEEVSPPLPPAEMAQSDLLPIEDPLETVLIPLEESEPPALPPTVFASDPAAPAEKEPIEDFSMMATVMMPPAESAQPAVSPADTTVPFSTEPAEDFSMMATMAPPPRMPPPPPPPRAVSPADTVVPDMGADDASMAATMMTSSRPPPPPPPPAAVMRSSISTEDTAVPMPMDAFEDAGSRASEMVTASPLRRPPPPPPPSPADTVAPFSIDDAPPAYSEAASHRSSLAPPPPPAQNAPPVFAQSYSPPPPSASGSPPPAARKQGLGRWAGLSSLIGVGVVLVSFVVIQVRSHRAEHVYRGARPPTTDATPDATAPTDVQSTTQTPSPATPMTGAAASPANATPSNGGPANPPTINGTPDLRQAAAARIARLPNANDAMRKRLAGVLDGASNIRLVRTFMISARAAKGKPGGNSFDPPSSEIDRIVKAIRGNDNGSGISDPTLAVVILGYADEGDPQRSISVSQQCADATLRALQKRGGSPIAQAAGMGSGVDLPPAGADTPTNAAGQRFVEVWLANL